MRLRARWQTGRRHAATFWQQRSRREQTMLAVAGGLALLVALFSLLLDPALHGRARLQERLPTLHRQAAELTQLLTDATPPLSTEHTSGAPALLTQAQVDTMLAQHALTATRVAADTDGVRLELAGASLPALLASLDDLRSRGALMVREARINAAATPGLVDATIVLVRKDSP